MPSRRPSSRAAWAALLGHFQRDIHLVSVVDSGDHAVLHCDGEHREQGALSALAAGGAAGPIQGKSDLRPEGTAFLSPHQGGTHGQQALVLQR